MSSGTSTNVGGVLSEMVTGETLTQVAAGVGGLRLTLQQLDPSHSESTKKLAMSKGKSEVGVQMSSTAMSG